MGFRVSGLAIEEHAGKEGSHLDALRGLGLRGASLPIEAAASAHPLQDLRSLVASYLPVGVDARLLILIGQT